MKFEFDGEPKAVQSFRFTRGGIKYQPKEVVDWKTYIKLQAKQQLPANHQLLDTALRIEVDFIFQPLKSWSKKKLAVLESGELMYKTSKPDLTDNLMKGLIDALSGIVWKADQQICEVHSRKFYGKKATTKLEVYKLEESK